MHLRVCLFNRFSLSITYQSRQCVDKRERERERNKKKEILAGTKITKCAANITCLRQLNIVSLIILIFIYSLQRSIFKSNVLLVLFIGYLSTEIKQDWKLSWLKLIFINIDLFARLYTWDTSSPPDSHIVNTGKFRSYTSYKKHTLTKGHCLPYRSYSIEH
jgi:hypothetical protein